MSNQWFINKQSQIEHKHTRETSEFGLNGELYDIIPEGENAGFSVIVRNVVAANDIISDGLTPYHPSYKLQHGEELVARLPIQQLNIIRNKLQIQDIKMQVVIANRV